MPRRFFKGHRFLLTACFLVVFSGIVWPARAQEPTPSPTPTASPAATPEEPVYTNYRGVSIDMNIAEAREKLGSPKSKGKRQDFYVFSDQESAQVFYLNNKVSAISIDYLGESAPTPMEVFGVDVKPMKNGRIYKMARYRTAGYWVAYNRTAGNSPIVSITMRRIASSKP